MKKIEVFGPGCPKCKKTADIIHKVAQEKGLKEGQDYELTKITDISQIAAKGILSTPGVAVDGEIVSRGRIPKKNTIGSWLT